MGIKFFDIDNKILLNCGYNDDDDGKYSSHFPVKKFIVQSEERLIGIKSGGREKKKANYFDIQFLIGRME